MENTEPTTKIKQFEPLNVMGIFWLSFGIFVLFATFFIKGNPQVPLVMSRVTNISAGVIIVTAGIICLLKARAKRKNRTAS